MKNLSLPDPYFDSLGNYNCPQDFFDSFSTLFFCLRHYDSVLDLVYYNASNFEVDILLSHRVGACTDRHDNPCLCNDHSCDRRHPTFADGNPGDGTVRAYLYPQGIFTFVNSCDSQIDHIYPALGTCKLNLTV